jgi:hypothetical protein
MSPAHVNWTVNAHSTKVPVCPLRIPVAPGATNYRWDRWLLAGEGIIAPILCALTTMIPFSFASRVWVAVHPGGQWGREQDALRSRLNPEEWPLPAPRPCATWGY